MNEAMTELIWLNSDELCSLEHLADVSGLTIDEIRDLVDCGLIEPDLTAMPPRVYALRYVSTALVARRLRDDFLLDQHGVTLALTLMERIQQLESELNSLRVMMQPLQSRQSVRH